LLINADFLNCITINTENKLINKLN